MTPLPEVLFPECNAPKDGSPQHGLPLYRFIAASRTRTSARWHAASGGSRALGFALLAAAVAPVPAALGAAGCGGSGGGGNAPTTIAPGASALSAEAYCRVAATPGLRSWHRDLVTVCDDRAPVDAPPNCQVSVVQADGRLVPTPIEGAVLARRLAGDRVLVRTREGAIVIVGADGRPRLTLAAWGEGPGVSPDGRLVAFVTAVEGAPPPMDGMLDPAVGRRVVLWTVGESTALRTVLEDDAAMAAWPFPSGEDVAFVSTRSGVAALWRVNLASELAFQVTNQGMTEVEQDFVPPPGEGAIWLGTRPVLVYDATMATQPHIWRADLESGEAVEVGPGEWPVPRDATTLNARASAVGDATCAAAYPVAGGGG
jgi:hypothetical protein